MTKLSDSPVRPSTCIGLDIGDRFSQFTVLLQDGAMIKRGRLATREPALRATFGKLAAPGARIALEVSTHSPWITRVLTDMGFEVVVANPRKLPVSRSRRKNDRIDADLLARYARVDPELLCPVAHRGDDARLGLAWIRQRETQLAVRTTMVNNVRGTVKSFGARVRKCDADYFHRHARNDLAGHPEILELVESTLALIESTTVSLAGLDRRIEKLAASLPIVELFKQVHGVGTLTAVTYALVIEDPRRFRRSRSVGAYVGLVPRQCQSGDSDPQLRISKTGDRMLRCLLVNVAHYLIGGRNKHDSTLRRFGLSIAGDGQNKTAKKRAVVAVARKLAVLLHSMWMSGQAYEPLRGTATMTAA